MPKTKNAASKISSKSKSMSKSMKKTAPASKGIKGKKGGDEKRKIRFKPGTVALREIKRY